MYGVINAEILPLYETIGESLKKKHVNFISRESPKEAKPLNLRTFALIVYAHPYWVRNSCHNAMLRHARARAQRKKSIYIKGWYPLR